MDKITEKIIKRLHELSDAVTKGKNGIDREFYMSIPARPYHDADLVLARAAKQLKNNEIEIGRLRKALKQSKEYIQAEKSNLIKPCNPEWLIDRIDDALKQKGDENER